MSKRLLALVESLARTQSKVPGPTDVPPPPMAVKLSPDIVKQPKLKGVRNYTRLIGYFPENTPKPVELQSDSEEKLSPAVFNRPTLKLHGFQSQVEGKEIEQDFDERTGSLTVRWGGRPLAQFKTENGGLTFKWEQSDEGKKARRTVRNSVLEIKNQQGKSHFVGLMREVRTDPLEFRFSKEAEPSLRVKESNEERPEHDLFVLAATHGLKNFPVDTSASRNLFRWHENGTVELKMVDDEYRLVARWDGKPIRSLAATAPPSLYIDSLVVCMRVDDFQVEVLRINPTQNRK
jgi:hypothetical protein